MRNNERGFTLLESMLAAAVFTVGSLGLLGLIITSSKGLSTGERISQATTLARSKLDEFRRTPYDLVVDGHEVTNLGPLGETLGAYGATSDSDGWFARSWTVTTPSVGLEYKEVRVQVQWYDRTMEPQAVRTVALVGGRSRQ